MRKVPWMAWVWPGLPLVWGEGAWSGLALAVGFAGLFNLLLLATLVWVELLAPLWLALGWLSATTVWVAASIYALRSRGRRQRFIQEVNAEDLFRQALSEYLQGSWFEAETTLSRLLEHYPRDLEARLMLATLLRHTRRHEEARAELGRLERSEGSQTWTQEIAAEREWLAQAAAGESHFSAPQKNDWDVSRVSQAA